MAKEEELLFESDVSGRIIRLRGVEVPKRLVHIIGDSWMNERAPGVDTTWVLRGAYAFARRIRGENQ